MISTQWPYQPAGQGTQPSTVFEVRPRLLGNTTLETYIQETSSCMGCHAVAGTDRMKNWVSADFTFTLNDAFPVPNQDPTSPPPDRVPRKQRVIRPPAKPVSPWDLEHWNDVTTGYQIAQRHLHRGRREHRGLLDRALRSGPTMRALTTYLKWLDEQWQDWKERTPSRKASAARGSSVFQQKCAFCHGAEGQGRYLSHTYYRPALWGPYSYNIQAGMGSNLQYLAAFVHANMPYGNGVALTVEEGLGRRLLRGRPEPARKAGEPPGGDGVLHGWLVGDTPVRKVRKPAAGQLPLRPGRR